MYAIFQTSALKLLCKFLWYLASPWLIYRRLKKIEETEASIAEVDKEIETLKKKIDACKVPVKEVKLIERLKADELKCSELRGILKGWQEKLPSVDSQVKKDVEQIKDVLKEMTSGRSWLLNVHLFGFYFCKSVFI